METLSDKQLAFASSIVLRGMGLYLDAEQISGSLHAILDLIGHKRLDTPTPEEEIIIEQTGYNEWVEIPKKKKPGRHKKGCQCPIHLTKGSSSRTTAETSSVKRGKRSKKR